MKSINILPIAAAISLAALAACSKPADQAAGDAAASTATAVSDVADSATDTAASATAAGGAVSPPAANGAINADANTTATNVAPASNSFTEGEAKGHLESAGYTNVSGLTKSADGLWTGKATKDGKTMDVALDFKGAVTAR